MDVKSVLYMTGCLWKHSEEKLVNWVSLDSILTLRSCHLFLISALFKQYSLAHETHLNGVR